MSTELPPEIEKWIITNTSYLRQYPWLTSDEIDDIQQECRIQAWKAYRNYDTNRGPLQNLIVRVIQLTVKYHLRTSGRRANHFPMALEYDEPLESPDLDSDTIASRIWEVIPEPLRPVANLLLAGFNNIETAAALGITQRQVNVRIKYIRNIIGLQRSIDRTEERMLLT